MKLLIAHPGATWSIQDVYDGLIHGLEQLAPQGVEIVGRYHLAARQERAHKGLLMAYRGVRESFRRAGQLERCPPKPTWGDAMYEASWHILHPALRTDCDWVVIVSGMFFHPDALVMLRRAGKRVAIVFTESPYDDDQQLAVAPLVDACFVNERSSVDRFRAVNPSCFYLPMGYNPVVHAPDAPLPPGDFAKHDVVLVGTAWPERLAILQAVDWSGIDLGLYGTWGTNLPAGDPLLRFVRGGITDNAVTSALYRRASVGLNWHRTMKGFRIGQTGEALHVAHAESMNPRCYELAACGCFWMSDRRAELTEVFGDSVPTFADAKELQEQLQRWLPDEAGRRRLARDARDRVKPHSWVARAEALVRSLGGLQEWRTSTTAPPAS